MIVANKTPLIDHQISNYYFRKNYRSILKKTATTNPMIAVCVL